MITLQDFNHFRSDPRVKFKTEDVDGETFTIISYMIADSNLWTQPLALETRGITFDSTGKCVSRPLQKFFNVGEREETQLNNLEFYNSIFVEKRDGSMLIPVLINDKIHWKSKKSFYSDVAIQAGKCATLNVRELSRTLIECGYTPVFEFTHPQHQIVIDYGNEPRFVLIAIRKIETGEYMSFDEQEMIAASFKVDCIRRYRAYHQDLLDELETRTDFEGYVIRHLNGMWTKAKSKWYFIMHHIMTEIRERDVALAVADEQVDDLKSLIVREGKSVDPINEIEQRVVGDLEAIIAETNALFELIEKEPTRKDAALKYSRNEFFSLAMCLYVGREPDYKKFWKTKHLKVDYSLRVIYNQSFSGEE